MTRHPEAPERSEGLEGCTATQVGCCRLAQFRLPISGKPEIGGRHPSRLAARAPQGDGEGESFFSRWHEAKAPSAPAEGEEETASNGPIGLRGGAKRWAPI